MMITDRKNAKDSDDPEERYIGFATNHPTIKTEVYAKRWRMRPGTAKPRNAGPKHVFPTWNRRCCTFTIPRYCITNG